MLALCGLFLMVLGALALVACEWFYKRGDHYLTALAGGVVAIPSGCMFLVISYILTTHS